MHALLRAAIVATFLCSVGWLGIPGPGMAHDAPSGWSYPAGCCSDRDCSPLEAGDLRYTITDDGDEAWLVVATGEVIPASEVRPSPDRMNHRCIFLHDGMTRWQTFDGQRTWCLWIAEGSF